MKITATQFLADTVTACNQAPNLSTVAYAAEDRSKAYQALQLYPEALTDNLQHAAAMYWCATGQRLKLWPLESRAGFRIIKEVGKQSYAAIADRNPREVVDALESAIAAEPSI